MRWADRLALDDDVDQPARYVDLLDDCAVGDEPLHLLAIESRGYGILFADFVFLRRRRLSLWSIFEDAPQGEYHYRRGFNWVGLGSIVLGQAVYLFLYNPLSGETHDWFRFMPASIAAFLVPAVVYWGVMRRRASRDESRRTLAPEAGELASRRLISPNI